MIRRAYESTAVTKYDTTYCAAEWELASGDAITDLAQFVTQLAVEYKLVPELVNTVDELVELINMTVVHKISGNGKPWFADPQPDKEWKFDDEKYQRYRAIHRFCWNTG